MIPCLILVLGGNLGNGEHSSFPKLLAFAKFVDLKVLGSASHSHISSSLVHR